MKSRKNRDGCCNRLLECRGVFDGGCTDYQPVL